MKTREERTLQSDAARIRTLCAIVEGGPEASSVGEVAAAQSLLDALLERYGSLESIRSQVPSPHQLDCSIRMDGKVCSNMLLVSLGLNLMGHIMGRWVPYQVRRIEVEEPSRGLKVKFRKIMVLQLECTELEYKDWVDCFRFYAKEFEGARQMLAYDIKMLNKEYNALLPSFFTRKDIDVPMTDKPRKISGDGKLAVAVGSLRFSRTRWAKNPKLK